MMNRVVRTLALGAITALLSASLAQAQAAKKNLVKNPGLEKGRGNKFSNWNLRVSTSEATEEGEFHGGARAAKIVHKKADYNSISQKVKVKPNTVYTASAWLRGEKIVPNPNAACARIFIGRAKDGGTIRASAKLKGTFVWHKAMVTFNSREHSEVVFMVYLHKSTGTLYIDDLELIEGKIESPDKSERSALLSNDLERTAQAIKKAGNPGDLRSKLAALRKQAAKAPLKTPFDYTLSPPYSSLHEKIYKLHALALTRIHPGKRLMLWQADDFDALSVPPKGARVAMRVDMMKNEWESAAFNITNLTQQTQTATVDLAKAAFPVKRIIVRQSVVVPKVTTGTVPDALRKLKPTASSAARYAIKVAPGATTQVWLEINGRGLTKAGDHRGKVSVVGVGLKQAVGFDVKVHNVTFPDAPRLRTYNYAYMYWVSPYEKQAIADMMAHYIDTFVIHPRYLPQVSLAGNDKTGPFDFSKLDEQIELHKGARGFLLWMGFDWPHRRVLHKSLKFGSPQWERVFREWISAIDARMVWHGVKRNQYAFYPVDEPSIAGGDRNNRRATLIKVAALIKKINPKIQVFTDPILHGDVPRAAMVKLAKNVDIVSPTHRIMSPKNVVVFQSLGKELWVYQCSVPGKDLSPFDYYRLAGWRAWQWKAKAHGLWDYFDLMPTRGWGAQPGTQGSGSVVFIGTKHDQETIVPSRRWKAWREGVEDNETLAMLEDGIQKKLGSAAAREAKKLLAGLRARIEKGLTSREHTLIRRKVIELLVKLQ